MDNKEFDKNNWFSIEQAKEISENYGKLFEIREKLLDLINNKSGNVIEIATCLIDIVSILKDVEMRLIIMKK